MSPAEAARAVFARWINTWPTLSSGVPYTLDNVAAAEGDGYFARVALVSLGSEQETLGPPGKRKWLHEGLIDVRLSGPVNVGRGQLDILAGYVTSIYRGVRFGTLAGEQGVTTEATDISELRRDREAPHRWILTASTPCRWTEIG